MFDLCVKNYFFKKVFLFFVKNYSCFDAQLIKIIKKLPEFTFILILNIDCLDNKGFGFFLLTINLNRIIIILFHKTTAQVCA